MKTTLLLLMILLPLLAAEPGSFQYEIIDSGVWMLIPFLSIPITITIIIVAIILIIKTLIAGIKTLSTPKPDTILSSKPTNPRKEWRE